MNEAKPAISKFDYDYDTDLLGFREVNGQLIPVHRMHPEPTKMHVIQNELVKKPEPKSVFKKADADKNKMIIDDNGKKFIILKNQRVPLYDIRLKVEPKLEPKVEKKLEEKPVAMRGIRAKIQNLLIDRKVLTRDLLRAQKQVRILKRELHKTKLGKLKYMRECKLLRRKSRKATNVKVKARRRTKVRKDCVTQTDPEPVHVELSLEIAQQNEPISEENSYVENLYPLEDNFNFNESVLRENVNMGFGVPVPRLDPKAEQLEKLKWIMLACIKMCNVPDTNGDFPIHNAVLSGIDAVRRQCAALKLRKISVDLVNSDGYTPLQLAVLNRAPAPIMKELKSYGADSGVLDHQGNTIYHLAVMNSHLSTMYQNDLLPVINNAVNNYNYQGLTPLMICAKQNNHIDAMVLVRELKADLNLQDKTSGRTALFHAVESKSENMVDLLLRLNADRSVKNFVGLMIQEAITELDVSPKIIAMLQKKVSEVASSDFKLKGRKYAHSQKIKFISKKVKVSND